MKTSVPLINGIVNNALFHYSPHINQMLPQIIHSLHFCLADSLLKYAARFCTQLVEVMAVHQPQICHDECMAVGFTQLLHNALASLQTLQTKIMMCTTENWELHSSFGTRHINQ